MLYNVWMWGVFRSVGTVKKEEEGERSGFSLGLSEPNPFARNFQR